MLGDLADVQQTVGAREKFDEGAELGQADHFAEVGLAYFGDGGDVADHLQRAGQALGVARCNVDPSRLVDVDLDLGGFDDSANHLATRPYQVADLVGRNLQGANLRSMLRLFGARRCERGVHLVEQPQPAVARLFERLAHDLAGYAADLDVHLQRGNALAGARYLEVHVAVVVFGPGNVGQDGISIA